ncbi:sulfatase-like hydrolase/transferase [Cerasicoccus frondis]|uniref:sulfatase-like hydrolase/transferase n=1 Tax=Cerasicoccus frondis TaxID=490090 RepID=UPI002852A431|nr:sulfatase-like hydrolase/transferase [Cerasicoccus frondis]
MQPNIIVFFTDQQRWDTLGLNGNRAGLTPNFDRFARQGTFFKQGVTPQPVCGPARSCLQTGQYATTTGCYANGIDLSEDSPKLAELFAEAGYRTAYFGKWHLSNSTGKQAVPTHKRAGYQDWLGANTVETTSGPYSARLWDTDDNEVQLPGYRSDAQTDAMIRYLGDRAAEPKDARQPFLLFHSYIEPHHQNTDDSYPAPRGYEELYRDAPLPPDLLKLGGSAPQHWPGYCGMIKRLDESLGRLMDALESTGLAENTIVAFISDHGCHFKTRNAEYKRSPHEASIRVPFAIWGGQWNGGGERQEAANLVDLMPSLLDSANIAIPESVEGRSLLPLTRNETAGWPEETFIQFGDGGMPIGRVIRTNRWKYAVTAPEEYKGKADSPTYTESQLYDLQTDPYELANLVDFESHAPVREAMRRRLLSYIQKIERQTPSIEQAPQRHGGQRTIEYPNSSIASY